jgi:iron complex outermembrane receptor protein
LCRGRLGTIVARLSGLAAAGLLAAPLTAAADGDGAATPQPALESIVVTGSNLRRTDTEISSPVTSISAAEIAKSGQKTIADVIRSVSADNSGTLTQNFSGAMAGGASGVSLRGMSVDATLVLLDGHRMAPYPLADDGQRPFVDISSLPLGIVDRVEVLRDGASAIYGSDAIAGVVNIILKKEFVGLDVAASAGTSYKHDGGSERASITYGFGDLATDTRNLYFNLEVRHSDAIAQNARGSYLGTMDLTSYGGPDLRGGVINGDLPYAGTTYTVPGQVVPLSGAANNEVPFLLPGCSAKNLVPGTTTDALGNTVPFTGANNQQVNGCAWDTNQYKKIQPKTDGLNVSGHWTQNLASGWQSQLSVNLFQSNAEQYRQSNSYNVGTNLVPFAWAGSKSGAVNQLDPTTSRVLLPANSPDNPFNPANTALYNAAMAYYGATAMAGYTNQPALFFGALTDIAPQHSIYKTNVYRFVEDVSGTLGSWDVAGSIGHIADTTNVRYLNYLKPSVFYAALANGSYRVGQNAYRNTPAVYAAIAPESTDTATSAISYVSVNASRNLAPLPGGELALATGAELRRLSAANPGQPGGPQGDVQMDGSFFAEGSQNVYAAYAELNAPVLRSLDADAALRADHYQNTGTSVTPKVGFKWKPLREFALRGTFARGFRAPGIAESGNAGTGTSTGPAPIDPARCGPGLPNTNQDCGGPGSSIAILTRSNHNLKPEKSHSITLGFIFEPVQNLSLTVDYYRIRRDGEIFSAPYTTNNAIRTTPTAGSTLPGEVLGYLTPFVNASYSLNSGIDTEIKSRFDLKQAGKLTAKLDVTHILMAQQTFGDTTYHFVGTVGPTSLGGSVGTPATKGSFTLDWTLGAVNLGAIYSYHSPLKGVDEAVGSQCLQLNDPGHCYVASFGYASLYGSYQWSQRLELTANIDNVTNRLPPLDAVTYGGQNYNASLDQAGAVGRYMQVGFRYHL